MLTMVSPTAVFEAMPDEKKETHRAKIIIRVRAFLDNFYVEKRDAAVMAVELELWANALQVFKHSEIMAAFGTYFNTGPRAKTGKLLKPDPGAITALIYKSRPKPVIIHEPEEARVEPSSEEKARVSKVADDYLKKRRGIK